MGWLQAVRQDPADQATDFCHYQEPKLFPDETPLQCEQLMKAKQFNADRPSDSAVNAAYLSSVRESGVPLPGAVTPAQRVSFNTCVPFGSQQLNI